MTKRKIANGPETLPLEVVEHIQAAQSPAVQEIALHKAHRSHLVRSGRNTKPHRSLLAAQTRGHMTNFQESTSGARPDSIHGTSIAVSMQFFLCALFS